MPYSLGKKKKFGSGSWSTCEKARNVLEEMIFISFSVCILPESPVCPSSCPCKQVLTKKGYPAQGENKTEIWYFFSYLKHCLRCWGETGDSIINQWLSLVKMRLNMNMNIICQRTCFQQHKDIYSFLTNGIIKLETNNGDKKTMPRLNYKYTFWLHISHIYNILAHWG